MDVSSHQDEDNVRYMTLGKKIVVVARRDRDGLDKVERMMGRSKKGRRRW